MDNVARMADALGMIRAPLFLARRAAGSDSAIILHTAERRSAGRLRASASEALAGIGLHDECRVVTHRPRSLARARSLESVARRLKGGEIVFDPTGVVGRIEAIVDFATRVRRGRAEI